jgi:acyl-CoA thioesterase FadM
VNLWFRLIYLLLFGSRGRIGVLDTARLRMRVWPGDLDLNFHANNGRYLTMADLGRLDWFRRTGLLQIALRQRAQPLVGDALAKFRRDLRLFQTFEMHTRFLGWDERWGFLEHRFVRGGRVLGVVVIRGMFRNAAGPLKPDELVSTLGVAHDSPPLPEWVLSWHRACEDLSGTLRAEEGRAS